MDFLGATVLVILVAVLLHLLGVIVRTRQVVSVGREATATLRDASLSDDEKERCMRRNSIQLFRLLALLIISTAISLSLPLALIWALQFTGLISLDGVLRMFLRWDFLIGGTVLGIIAYIASVKWLRRSS